VIAPNKVRRGCPHDNIVHCPLYWAMHEAQAVGLSCFDQQMDGGGCAIDRGLDYAEAVERLRSRFPRVVAEHEFAEATEQAKQQRARNMRAAGVQ
jgi:hypothetical protein